MKRTIPFVPFKLHVARKFARPFFGIGEIIEKVMPSLEMFLKQSEIDLEPREYISIAIFSSVFWFSIIFSTVFVLAYFLSAMSFIAIELIMSSILSVVFFIYILLYPKLIIVRKLKSIEKNLLYGLRDLAVQIKSGVPLFDAMVSISRKGYGKISEEFGICVKKISTGISSTDALEDMALINPSLNFRRSIWQMVNSIRSGTDLGNTLENVVITISNEQRIQIKKYGSQLNPLAMMYMMLGVILPSLGITFLIILSSFSGFAITTAFFWLILIILILFQFAFVGIVKSRRPSIEV